MGRLSPEKGCWTLIHAFEKLPHISLKIVGTGPMEQDLRNYIRDKGIKNIELSGIQERRREVGSSSQRFMPGASVGVVREFPGDRSRRLYGWQTRSCFADGRPAVYRGGREVGAAFRSGATRLSWRKRFNISLIILSKPCRWGKQADI